MGRLGWGLGGRGQVQSQHHFPAQHGLGGLRLGEVDLDSESWASGGFGGWYMATCESPSKPIGTKMGEPRTMLQELQRRISVTISGWDCPLTFIYPGFDCGNNVGSGFQKIQRDHGAPFHSGKNEHA